MSDMCPDWLVNWQEWPPPLWLGLVGMLLVGVGCVVTMGRMTDGSTHRHSNVVQSTQPGWIADARTGCKVWNTNPQPNETVTWSGACQNGFAQGHGTLQAFLNERPIEHFEGEYRDGKAAGYGVAMSPNGDSYMGDWKDGRRNGHGVLTVSNDYRYDGEWRNGRKNGHGVLIANDGFHYNGEWRDNQKTGREAAVDSNGDRYDGEWQDDLPNGEGLMVSSSGDTHNGLWVKGCFRNGDRIASFDVAVSSCQ